jgi:hypothetical protein
MKTLDDLLVDVGEALDRLSATHEAAIRPGPARRRTRSVAVAAAGLVAIVGVAAVVALARSDESPGSIRTTEPVDSVPVPTGVGPPTQPADSAPTTDVLVPTPPPANTRAPRTSTALEDIGPDGAPVVPAVLPDGYRAVMADHAEGEATGLVISEPGGWLATYIDRSGDTSSSVPFIQVQIGTVGGGDVYASLPWAPGSPDVQIGGFTGRVANGEPESVTAIIPLKNDRRLVISGTKTSLAAIETIASGLELRDDGQGADATVLPDGFELIDEGPVSGPAGSAEWRVAYAKDERQDTMFMVTTTVDPARPAVFQLAMPMGGEVRIGNRIVYRTPNGFVFDVGTLQVNVQWSGIGVDGLQQPDDELAAVVASLVAIAPEDFARIRADVLAHPLTPIDLDCGVYVIIGDPDGADPARPEPITVTPDAPGSLQRPVRARQPVLDVEFIVSGTDENGIAIQAPIARVDALGDAAIPMTFTWDGTVDGKPASPGTYYLGARARPDMASGASCRSPEPSQVPDGAPSGLVPGHATFVVP